MSSLFYLVNVAAWFYIALRIVIADDVLEYQLLSFENPDGLLANDQCCDVIPILKCNSRLSACDNDFTVCIDSLNSGSGMVFCTKKVQFGTEEDTNTVRFGNTLGRTGKFENPIKVLYKRWQGGVKIKVRVKDRDADIDDLVGRFTGFYRRTLAAPSKQAAAWESLTIGSGTIKLKGRIRVYCTTCVTPLPTTPSKPPSSTPSKPSPGTVPVSKPSPASPISYDQSTSYTHSEIPSPKKDYPKWVWIVVWVAVGYGSYVTLVGFIGGIAICWTREKEKPKTLRYIIYVALAPIALPVVVIVCCLAECPGCLDCDCGDCDGCGGCDCGGCGGCDCGGCDCGGCDCGGCDCGGCVIM